MARSGLTGSAPRTDVPIFLFPKRKKKYENKKRRCPEESFSRPKSTQRAIPGHKTNSTADRRAHLWPRDIPTARTKPVGVAEMK